MEGKVSSTIRDEVSVEQFSFPAVLLVIIIRKSSYLAFRLKIFKHFSGVEREGPKPRRIDSLRGERVEDVLCRLNLVLLIPERSRSSISLSRREKSQIHRILAR